MRVQACWLRRPCPRITNHPRPRPTTPPAPHTPTPTHPHPHPHHPPHHPCREERVAEDDEIVQAVNDYTRALQDGLRLVNTT
jgi:hypothetical protein